MEQKFKKHLSPWIAWAIVALMAGIAGFCIWYYYDQITTAYDNSVAAGLTRKKTPTSTPTISTADWKTYINTKYGYSLKIPKNYGTLDTFDGSYRSTISETDNLINLGSESNAKSTIVLLSSKSTIADWLKQNNNDWAKSDINIGISKNIKAKNVIISGLNTYHEFNSVVLIEKDGNLLEIAEQNNRSILDQILSTFQFSS